MFGVAGLGVFVFDCGTIGIEVVLFFGVFSDVLFGCSVGICGSSGFFDFILICGFLQFSDAIVFDSTTESKRLDRQKNMCKSMWFCIILC